MSPPKNVKGQTGWLLCESCNTNILRKDLELHNNDCPPNLHNTLYNFVKNNVLYGRLDVKNVEEEIKGISKEFLVFLSEDTIRLCGLSIGDSVCVQFSDNLSSAVSRTVWPTTEKSLTTVLLNKTALEQIGAKIQDVRLYKMETVTNALNIDLLLLNGPESFEISQELSSRLQKHFLGRDFCVGNKLSVLFYGSFLKFKVKSFNNSDDSLVENFEQLNIGKQQFFQICSLTKWKIFRSAEQPTKSRNLIKTIGGLDFEIQEVQDIIKLSISKTKSALPRPRSVLLYGHSGTGKSLLADAISSESNYNTIKISASDLYNKVIYETSPEEKLNDLFDKAIQQSPSIIILDEVDLLAPVRSQRITESEKKIISTLITKIDQAALNDNRVFIIAITSRLDNIDPSLRRCGRLDREIEIPTPNPKGRREILSKFLPELNAYTLDQIASSTHGFVGADLLSLCQRAELNSSKNGRATIELSDFKEALKSVKPSAMREVQIEIPNVKWSDIGGQEKLKLILKQSVEWPLRHPESFTRLGITPPKGVLMFGPPGCSKTMIAKALATESGLNFLSIKGPELFSKWVGESEKAVREIFRKARQVAPSVIFFDEIDALGGERGSGSSTSVQERVLAQLLTELDGVSPLGDVTILAATNRPDRIDRALLRPGRLDRIVYVPLPDNATRRQIFQIKLSKMTVSPDISLDKLVDSTEGCSGAEVNAVCHEAAMKALEEDLEAKSVEARHFVEALKLITPRTSLEMIRLYEDYVKIKN